MAPSVYSVSSLGDEAGDHESTPRVPNVRLSREPVEQGPGQGSVNIPQGTASSQRLLRDDDPKTYGRNFTETGYEAPKKHQPRDKLSWYHDWWFSCITEYVQYQICNSSYFLFLMLSPIFGC